MNKTILIKILKIFLSIIFICLIFYIWLPIAKQFYAPKLPPGFDTFNFFYYLDYFLKNPASPITGWNYRSFEGIPRLLDYTWLNFYLVIPLVKLIGIFPAGKLYLVGYLFLFLVFSYLLFNELSDNPILSFALAVLMTKMGSLYLPLYNSGVAISSISQVCFPATLFFIAKFGNCRKRLYLYLAAITVSFGFYTHPGTTLTTTLVAAVFLLIFLKVGVKNFFEFFLTTGLLSSFAMLPIVYTKFFEGANPWLNLTSMPAKTLNGFQVLYDSTNPVLYFVVPVALVLGIAFMWKNLKYALPYLIMVIYFFVFQLGTYLDINVLGGFIFPWRINWMLPITALAFIAALLSTRQVISQNKILNAVRIIVAFVVVPSVALISLQTSPDKVLGFNRAQMVKDVSLDKSLTTYDAYGKRLLDSIGADISFVEENQPLQKRFMSPYYTLNMGFSFISPMPVVKGGYFYSDGESNPWFFWMDAVITDKDQKKYNQPTAEKESLFLIDWYSVGYLYSIYSDPLSPWFFDSTKPYIENRIGNDLGSALLKVSENYTSPLVSPTNSEIIGFVGSRQAFDYFMRNLGILDYNSRYIIPIHIADYLEDVRDEDLSILDSLVIYSYKQKDKAKHFKSWDKIKSFMEKGGKVLVDTGSDSPEKYMDKLPDIFPVEKITSGSVGNNWDVNQKSDIFFDIDFSSFSPLTYEGNTWTVSYADTIRSQSEAYLSLSGEIVAAKKKIGAGEIVWSGLNLFYRPLYFHDNGENETKILKDILDKDLQITSKEIPMFDFQRPRSEKVIINSQNSKGIIFKENDYGGWYAKVNSNNKIQNLKIYKAGLDFMYVSIPKDARGHFEVTFEHKGRLIYWLFLAITVVGVLYIFEAVFLNKKITGGVINAIVSFIKRIGRKIFSWWTKDSEEI